MTLNTIETVIHTRTIAMSMENVMRMKEIKSMVRVKKVKKMNMMANMMGKY